MWTILINVYIQDYKLYLCENINNSYVKNTLR